MNQKDETKLTWDLWLHDEDCACAIERFERGERHGWHAKYFDNGMIACEGAFKRGEADGRWAFFHEDGTLAASFELRDGRRVTTPAVNSTQTLALAA